MDSFKVPMTNPAMLEPVRLVYVREPFSKNNVIELIISRNRTNDQYAVELDKNEAMNLVKHLFDAIAKAD
jgi:isocitrate dehydrogenase